jgi:hypothetical protein
MKGPREQNCPMKGSNRVRVSPTLLALILKKTVMEHGATPEALKLTSRYSQTPAMHMSRKLLAFQNRSGPIATIEECERSGSHSAATENSNIPRCYAVPSGK